MSCTLLTFFWFASNIARAVMVNSHMHGRRTAVPGSRRRSSGPTHFSAHMAFLRQALWPFLDNFCSKICSLNFVSMNNIFVAILGVWGSRIDSLNDLFFILEYLKKHFYNKYCLISCLVFEQNRMKMAIVPTRPLLLASTYLQHLKPGHAALKKALVSAYTINFSLQPCLFLDLFPVSPPHDNITCIP